MVIKKRSEIRLSSVLIYSLLLNSGAALMWPLITVYMHNNLHESLTVAGIVMFIMSCFMVLGNYLGGIFFDRWSPYKSALISITIAMIPIFLLIFFNGWPSFAILLFVYGLGEGASLTILNAYAAKVQSKSTRYVFNSLYIGINVGVVVGTTAVGFLMKFGVPVVFSVATFFYIILLLMTVFDFNIDFSKAQPHLDHKHNHQVMEKRANPLTSKLIFSICMMVFCVYLSYTLWESVMPVHMESLNISFENYSYIWPINGLLIVFVQPIINRIGRHFKMVNQVTFGILVFALTFFMLIFAKQYVSFIIIMIILTFGEMNGLPSIPAWIDNLADEKQKGRYQGMFNIFMSFGRAVGPLFGGILVEWLNYGFLFGISGLLIITSLLYVLWENRKFEKYEQS
ncbi:MDR family MFS transporter [Fructilactobacillus sanfranciscensis]|uniref:MDR family MFS transporter n=1 Tax=Fructilactobacillus sanfranciscensis TaxID=1625 RepID=UPI0013D36A40|nr:MFS transporter [Fructilactobacillus sanfranciscensis]NDR60927.1 MFS transporter [Fructilactobacillus sanfranciscensis]